VALAAAMEYASGCRKRSGEKQLERQVAGLDRGGGGGHAHLGAGQHVGQAAQQFALGQAAPEAGRRGGANEQAARRGAGQQGRTGGGQTGLDEELPAILHG